MAADDKELGAELFKVVGPKIATLREALGLSQEELAALAGLHRTAISPLELGKSGTRVVTVFRIAGVLGVPPVDLLGGYYWVPDGAGSGHFSRDAPDGSDHRR
jgi:transcriptional regulator with XRE-family HTH domain